jgi:hypothetical protein
MNKGTWTSTKYKDEAFLASVYEPLEVKKDFTQNAQLAYMAALAVDLDTGLLDVPSNPMAYAATKRRDPDTPDYHTAMSSEEAPMYLEAQKREIDELRAKDTWDVVPRSVAKGKNVLPGTWAFKKKRYPDHTVRKYKARFCCRGDRQIEGVDFFETYSPVVQWSSIRLLLTMTLTNDWVTRQVDYTNAFAQAELHEEVYVEIPRDFAPTTGGDFILKLKKSLYGLKQAPKTFFEKLSAGLTQRGFIQSEVDPCLFMKKGMLCVVYVDDTIFAGPDANEIEKVIASLHDDHDNTKHKFHLESEGEVQDFLGINIKKIEGNTYQLTQTGLTKKVLEYTGMDSSHAISTPADIKTLGTDKNGPVFNEQWDYASAVGMLMYLATNSRPDIAFAINQCARFTHTPRASHAKAVKRASAAIW